MKFEISLSRLEDLDCLPGVETRASRLFAGHPATRDLALDAEAPRDFRTAHASRLLWVARGDDATPAGFVMVEPMDGAWHLEEMDVDPAHGRQGIGSALVRAVLDAAVERGIACVTLCTFREVPWNAPFYARLGFARIEWGALSPGLRARMAEEEARGLPIALRVAMRWRKGRGI